jgi:hypothetical protein
MLLAKRTPKIYYIQEKQGQKALLIFDAGHSGGDIHVYEHKLTVPVEEIEKQIKKGTKLDIDDIRLWIERNYGTPLTWRLEPEG